ncbi:hypothetical protein JMJ35_007580 [Cladonia borealis]|uniref:Autophagy-related protein 29 n=1 Tax=Cladonia borealis TaxID=184061 RepID=A0AA39QYJ8_9LECA|nr:hypothetical protein JMJ35_007580 [Cladonia borealis]
MASSAALVNGDDVHYTVLVRLPFPRGDFVDPPPVNWNSTKERDLWSVISSSPFGQELDLQAIADRFDVSLPFLSQQCAWLFERHRSQLRAQVRKFKRPLSVGTSPTPDSASDSGTTGLMRGASGGSRVPSSLSHRSKERTTSHGDGSKEVPRAPMSRTTSTNTITQAQNASLSGSPRSPVERHSVFAHRTRSREPPHLPVEPFPRHTQRSRERPASPSAVASDSSASSSSDSEAPHPINRSRVFARRPRYSTTKAPLNPLSDADEEDEDSPPFLPFSDARKPTTPPPPTSPSATLKISPKRTPSHRQPPNPNTKLKSPKLPQTAHSSSSSAQSQPQSQNRPPQQSPLSTLSPRQRRLAKEGSDGTPSMGSSFSDLDDASVTQSAMEEALASNINRGVASRMSTISQAFRSNVFSGERKH